MAKIERKSVVIEFSEELETTKNVWQPNHKYEMDLVEADIEYFKGLGAKVSEKAPGPKKVSAK
jgi:hypothetical protein